MDLGQVVHMNGGDGETSYAKNSFHQVCVCVCVRDFIFDVWYNFLEDEDTQLHIIKDSSFAMDVEVPSMDTLSHLFSL